MTSFLLD